MLLSKQFEELTNEELYQILDIRNSVFVQEQRIIYVDTDYKDLLSRHYAFIEEGIMVSYLRVIPPGIKYKEHALSRVATKHEYRKLGYAKRLIEKAMEDLKGQPIRISAQAYLEPYYRTFGFQTVKSPYLEEGILHVEMLSDNR